MARINIEDSIFKDDRFINLCIAAGGRIQGIGTLCCLWIEAQKHYLKNKEIPNSEWIKSGLPEFLINTGWAERTSTGVRTRGQDEQFSWLIQKSNAGKSSSKKKTKNLKQNTERTLDKIPNGIQRGRTATEPPFSLLSSPSLSPALTHSSILKSSEGVAKRSPPEPTLGSRIFNEYSAAYQERWGKPPVRNATVNGQCTNLGKRLGEEAISVARFYVFHNKAFYVQSCHPIGLLLKDAEGLHTQWVTNKQVTRTEANAAENRQQIVNSFGKHLTSEDE